LEYKNSEEISNQKILNSLISPE